MAHKAGFICVFSGKRDSYQVPLGLQEAGLLDCLVSDFYAPRLGSRLLPLWLRGRRDDALPRSRTVSVLSAFLLSTALKVFNVRIISLYERVSRLLAASAERIARKRAGSLYCYHTFLPAAVPETTCLIVFVFHPLAALEREILGQDGARFPEVAATARTLCEGALAKDLAIDWERADGVVCASSFTARSVIADGCPPEKIAVIPYGLPETPRAPVVPLIGAREATAPARFLFVGQGVNRKGLHHLIRAWQAWRKTSALPARLVIVAYYVEPEIRAMIDHPEIELLGRQSRAALNRHFADADVFVLPSLVEGFGLVYLEALAHGCHVIGTENTGLPELPLGDGERTLVEAGSVDDLAAALERCATKAREGRFDRAVIQASAARWTQADFRARIGEHARQTLEKSGRPASAL